MAKKLVKHEYLRRSLKSKDIYYYKDEKEGFDVLSREVYKKKKLVVHYPFDRYGRQKYKYIKSIEFHDISPKIIDGIYKAVNYGLGFTRNLSPIIYYGLDNFPSIKKIKISPTEKSKIEKETAIFNIKDLKEFFNTIKPLKEVQASELKRIANNLLADIYPKKIKQTAMSYKKGELGLFIKDKKISSDKLSESDIENLIQILPDSIKERRVVYQAEEKINFIKLEKVKEEFRKLVKQKSDTEVLEAKCQKFFENNRWILSNILSMPVVFFKSKAYVGGKIYNNRGGKEADFLYKNKLTKNVFIVEIKTPLKKIIDSDMPYRESNIFSLGKEVTGGLVQVLDQKDKLQKSFNSISNGKYKSFNPKWALIIGRLTDLSKYQKESFELFRGSIKDGEIITYDELLEKTNLILGQFIANTRKKKNPKGYKDVI